MHSFAVGNLELGGELSYSGHVMSLYQLLPGLLISYLQTQTQHPAGSQSWTITIPNNTPLFYIGALPFNVFLG